MNVIDLKSGVHVTGVLPWQDVEVVAVNPVGDATNLVFQKIDGSYDSVILFPDDLLKLQIREGGDRRMFDGDPNGFLLAAEALRIKYSYVFDTRLAMHTSIIEPLPHQITAVYEDMMPRQPLRFLLADDPGAGKTIMAGLLIKELMIRGEVERCLIVCPGGLVQQWVEDELGRSSGLSSACSPTTSSTPPKQATPSTICPFSWPPWTSLLAMIASEKCSWMRVGTS